jgi:hypothetical protein
LLRAKAIKPPWRLYQNCERGITSPRFVRLDDGVMQYS